MPFVKQFRSKDREPFWQSEENDHHLERTWISSPLSYFNPTHAQYEVNYNVNAHEGTDKDDNDLHKKTTSLKYDKVPGVAYQWRSRDNRKGRHTIIVDSDATKAAGFNPPAVTNTFGQTLRRMSRMFTYYPVWDVSYWVAQTFTWGSVVFVFNGLCYLLPLAAPSTEFPGEAVTVAGITSFVGCVLYQVGVFCLMFEAYNENRTGCFGWALHVVIDDVGEDIKSADKVLLELRPSHQECKHHHANSHGITSKPTLSTQGWVWFPSWHDIRTHYIHELGFLGALIMFVSATIFWLVGWAALPGIAQKLSSGAIIGLSKTPDLIGSVGFVVASWILMLETQKNWYTPAWHSLGWWCNVCNLLGSIGFLLSAIFAFCLDDSYTCEYQSDASTTWGSGLFLIGSVILWYEAVNKYSVEEKKK